MRCTGRGWNKTCVTSGGISISPFLPIMPYYLAHSKLFICFSELFLSFLPTPAETRSDGLFGKNTVRRQAVFPCEKHTRLLEILPRQHSPLDEGLHETEGRVVVEQVFRRIWAVLSHTGLGGIWRMRNTPGCNIFFFSHSS